MASLSASVWISDADPPAQPNSLCAGDGGAEPPRGRRHKITGHRTRVMGQRASAPVMPHHRAPGQSPAGGVTKAHAHLGRACRAKRNGERRFAFTQPTVDVRADIDIRPEILENSAARNILERFGDERQVRCLSFIRPHRAARAGLTIDRPISCPGCPCEPRGMDSQARPWAWRFVWTPAEANEGYFCGESDSDALIRCSSVQGRRLPAKPYLKPASKGRKPVSASCRFLRVYSYSGRLWQTVPRRGVFQLKRGVPVGHWGRW